MAWMIPHGTMDCGHHMYADDVFDSSEDTKSKGRRRKKLLYKTVCNQMEFYFSDANLTKDRFLGQLVEDDPYIPLELFLSKFNKIKSMVSSVEELARALKKSDFLELSEDSLKIRRKTPVKLKENEEECTIYVENLPPEITHDALIKVFSEFGKVVYVSIPKYRTTHAPKGFAFVEFDTPKEASETIQIFMEKGSCLSPHMLPEKLCSIHTFENEKLKNHKPLQGQNGETNTELHAGDNVSLSADSQNVKTTADEEVSILKSSKKRKLEVEEGVDIEEQNREKKGKKHEACDKKEGVSKEESVVNSETSDSDIKGTKYMAKIETSENDSCEDNKVDQTSDEKRKKKNRKKKKRPKDMELFANGMLILSKKEWKRLRNKYINMQRVNMRKVKQQVLEARFLRRQPHMPHPGLDHGRDEEMRPPPPPVDAPKPRVTFVPGVIVCVKFTEPVCDIKAFKAEARTQPGVQYVDIHEGAFEAHLRCSGPSEAQHLLQLKFWKNMFVLNGPDEGSYWDKISKDREEKLGKKVKRQERGKKKLLRKAEVVKATHLHFDN